MATSGVGTGTSLSELERSWFQIRGNMNGLSVNAGTPLNELKRRYFISQIGGAAANINSLEDLEKQWLRAVIGSGVSNTRYLADLWRQAVGAKGLSVSVRMEENKKTFYRNVSIDIRTEGTGGWGTDQWGLFQFGLTNQGS